MQLTNSILGAPVGSSLKGELLGTKIKCPRGPSRVVMRKRETHPEMYEAKVFCKGEHVLTVDSTIQEYKVDVWSGNHPFYNGSTEALVEDDGRVDKFRKKFGSLDVFSDLSDDSDEDDSQE